MSRKGSGLCQHSAKVFEPKAPDLQRAGRGSTLRKRDGSAEVLARDGEAISVFGVHDINQIDAGGAVVDARRRHVWARNDDWNASAVRHDCVPGTHAMQVPSGADYLSDFLDAVLICISSLVQIADQRICSLQVAVLVAPRFAFCASARARKQLLGARVKGDQKLCPQRPELLVCDRVTAQDFEALRGCVKTFLGVINGARFHD